MNNQILEAEKKYWDGMASHNFEQVKNLTRFPCLIAGKNGVMSVEEEPFKKMFDSHKDMSTKVENISDAQTQMLTENTAIIIYQIDVTYGDKKMRCACTSTWQKENENWKCAMHSESEMKAQ